MRATFLVCSTQSAIGIVEISDYNENTGTSSARDDSCLIVYDVFLFLSFCHASLTARCASHACLTHRNRRVFKTRIASILLFRLIQAGVLKSISFDNFFRGNPNTIDPLPPRRGTRGVGRKKKKKKKQPIGGINARGESLANKATNRTRKNRTEAKYKLHLEERKLRIIKVLA